MATIFNVSKYVSYLWIIFSSQHFDEVQDVALLDSQDSANLALLARPELGVTFTKLHCWNLTKYRKCVFLDADTLVSGIERFGSLFGPNNGRHWINASFWLCISVEETSCLCSRTQVEDGNRKKKGFSKLTCGQINVCYGRVGKNPVLQFHCFI